MFLSAKRIYEIDAYLLNLVSRISDVKCYDNMFLTLESFKKQYQSIKQKEPYVRRSRSQMFLKIGILKNFPIFTGKHLCRSLFLWNFIKKRLRHSCFPVKEHFKRTFERTLRTLFLQNTSGDCFWLRECRKTCAVEYTTL